MVHSLWSGTRDQATSSLCPYKPPETKFHDWVLTCCRLKAGLLGIWGSDGVGSGSVYAHMYLREIWTGLPTHLDSGFMFSWNTENSHFAHSSCFILIGTQHIRDTNTVKQHPGGSNGLRKRTWNIINWAWKDFPGKDVGHFCFLICKENSFLDTVTCWYCHFFLWHYPGPFRSSDCFGALVLVKMFLFW